MLCIFNLKLSNFTSHNWFLIFEFTQESFCILYPRLSIFRLDGCLLCTVLCEARRRNAVVGYQLAKHP